MKDMILIHAYYTRLISEMPCGPCPLCNKSPADLQSHLKRMHPGYVPGKDERSEQLMKEFWINPDVSDEEFTRRLNVLWPDAVIEKVERDNHTAASP